MDLTEVGVWLITSIFGAAVIKLLDILVDKYKKEDVRITNKIKVLEDYTKEFGELFELYRFLGNVSSTVKKDKNGKLLRNKKGELITENRIFEADSRYEEAIKSIANATNIKSAIAQKTMSIRLHSAEANDIAQELDTSKTLIRKFRELHIAIFKIDNVLKNKNERKPHENFSAFVSVLDEANELRTEVNKQIQGLFNK